MKKIILGLFLTVGTTASVFASSNIKLENNIQKNKVLLSDCVINTTVSVKDSNGNLISRQTITTYGTGAQCNGSDDGLKIVIKTIKLEGSINP